jgi:hypothetical protein
MRLWLIPSMLLLTAAPALADEPGGAAPPDDAASGKVAGAIENDEDTQAAKKVLTEYLDLVAKKKYDPAKKLVHPKTLEVIAGIKKRLGSEQHAMAPQYWAKTDFYLKSYTLKASSKHLYGTIAFEASEKNFRVQEKGEDAEGEQTSYLLGKKDGKWLVTDKKTNGTFDDKSIKFDYKGYFDESAKPQADAEKPE